MEASVSTRQASELLGVHESSVKRWCNTEELLCWLTPGGHRRIPIPVLVSFAQQQGIEMPLRHFGQDAESVWEGLEQVRQHDRFDVLTDLVYGWVSRGQRTQLVRLIDFLRHKNLALGHILDRLVGAVMHRVGHAYVEGALSIGDEHRMSQVVRDALVLSRSEDPEVGQSNGHIKPVAIVGCGRTEMHELGALMVRLVLESAHWQVVYLGLNVPTEEFAMQQVKHGAQLVCLSMMPPSGMAEAQMIVRLLNQMYDPQKPYRLVLGGSALGNDETLNRASLALPDVRLFDKMQTFEAWVQQLPASLP